MDKKQQWWGSKVKNIVSDTEAKETGSFIIQGDHPQPNKIVNFFCK